jgi:hypothetical protein
MTHAGTADDRSAAVVNGDARVRASDPICLQLSTLDVRPIAETAYDLTCRSDLEAPGFCVVDLDAVSDPVALRRVMVGLKDAMDSIHRARTGGRLVYLSASRFDQRQTTRAHLDGGPEESLLMLGYEPSGLRATIEISDYSRCAAAMGLTPQAFMDRHNPMFNDVSALLRPYTVALPDAPSDGYRILCINNSSTPLSTNRSTWQGVLHAATIAPGAGTQTRFLNSTLIAAAPAGSVDAIGRVEQIDFIEQGGETSASVDDCDEKTAAVDRFLADQSR